MPYAELHCLSNLSFLRGVSSARELFARAKALGYTALAMTDECSFAGIVRALEASRATELPLIVGTEIQLEDGARTVLLATDARAYAALCRLITVARSRSAKGSYRASWSDLPAADTGVLALLVVTDKLGHVEAAADRWAGQLAASHPDSTWIAVELHRGDDDAGTLAALQDLGRRHGLRCVATGD